MEAEKTGRQFARCPGLDVDTEGQDPLILPILLVMKGLHKVKQGQDKTGRLFEHWFALGEPFMTNPSGAAPRVAGQCRKTLKTDGFPAVSLLASNTMDLRRMDKINES